MEEHLLSDTNINLPSVVRVFDLVNNHPVLVFQDFEVIESPILVFLRENKN